MKLAAPERMVVARTGDGCYIEAGIARAVKAVREEKRCAAVDVRLAEARGGRGASPRPIAAWRQMRSFLAESARLRMPDATARRDRRAIF
jgi:hypothetical protein